MGSILGHINRVLKSNVRWLIDKAGGPVVECEHRIGQIEQAIEAGRAAASNYAATYHRLERKSQQYRQSQDRLLAEAREALCEGQEDRARKLVVRKVELEERIASLQPGIHRGQEAYERLCRSLGDLQNQLIQAQTRLAELKDRKTAAEAEIEFDRALVGKSSGGLGEALEPLEEQVESAESEAEVRRDMRDEEGLDRALRLQSREMQVEAELESLRDRLDGEPRWREVEDD
ncbi:MAG: PspA/IM30 family protein [Phycisphaerae bacterium]